MFLFIIKFFSKLTRVNKFLMTILVLMLDDKLSGVLNFKVEMDRADISVRRIFKLHENFSIKLENVL